MANVEIHGVVTNQKIGPSAKKVRIQCNSGWADGNIVLRTSPDGGTTFKLVATIVNPTTGYGFEYWDVGTPDQFSNVSGNPTVSGTSDIYISTTGTVGGITVNTSGNMR